MFSPLMDKTKKGLHVYMKNSICEIHRKIYDVLVTELAIDRPDAIEKVVPLLEQAFIMGTKLNKRLVELRLKNVREILVGKEHDVDKTLELRKERIRLIALLEQNNQTIKEYGEPK